jgi:hypothetical protein
MLAPEVSTILICWRWGMGGLTAAEEKPHFGIWAIAKSPLLIRAGLAKIGKASLAVLLNRVGPLYTSLLNLIGREENDPQKLTEK